MQIRKLSEEEVRGIVGATRFTSELSKALAGLEVGEGIEIEGEVKAIRPRVTQFQKQQKRYFSVRVGDNGFVRIIRREQPLPEIGPVNPAIAGNPFGN